MVKLRAREIAAHRALCLLNQNGVCLLCNQHLTAADAVLDHCHRTGQVRGAIHRFCNTFLGKIENGAVRNRISAEQLAAILVNYTDYVARSTGILHPSHRTPEQKLERTRRLAQKRRRKKTNT